MVSASLSVRFDVCTVYYHNFEWSIMKTRSYCIIDKFPINYDIGIVYHIT